LGDHAVIGLPPETFFFIRRTRATPPGHAGEQERRGTYGTALEQFEELMNAASDASPAVRPLPLFYALSQAGRAIAAAYIPDDWRLYGHGLSCPDLDVEDPLTIPIKLTKPDPKKGVVDSFRRVSDATNSEIPKQDLSLGEVWAALPESGDLLRQTPGFDNWLPSLLAVPEEPGTSPLFPWARVPIRLVGLASLTAEVIEQRLGRYAHAKTLHIESIQGIPQVFEETTYGAGLRIYWPSDSPDMEGRRTTLNRVVPTAFGGFRWLRPTMADAVMNDPMIWWLLLFALSMLARYEPAGWVAALDLDRPLGASLIRLLDEAVEAIPELVLRELDPNYVTSGPTGG
jgi:hypothetical protein